MADVFVTGASGFVARNLRLALSAAYTSVVSASRTHIAPLPHETTSCVTHYTEDTLLEKISRCHTAVHLIGAGAQTDDTTYTNHIITRHIIHLCRRADIPHIVYLSGLGVKRNSPLSYFISKYNAEQEIIQSKLNYTILRPSYIIGSDDYLTLRLNQQRQKGAIIIPGSGRYPLQPVSIQDTIKVIMHAINHPSGDHIMDLVGPDIISFLHLARIISGPHTHMKHISIAEAYRQAILDDDPPYGIDELNIMISGYTGDHDIIQRHTGIRFQTIQDALCAGSVS